MLSCSGRSRFSWIISVLLSLKTLSGEERTMEGKGSGGAFAKAVQKTLIRTKTKVQFYKRV